MITFVILMTILYYFIADMSVSSEFSYNSSENMKVAINLIMLS